MEMVARRKHTKREIERLRRKRAKAERIDTEMDVARAAIDDMEGPLKRMKAQLSAGLGALERLAEQARGLANSIETHVEKLQKELGEEVTLCQDFRGNAWRNLLGIHEEFAARMELADARCVAAGLPPAESGLDPLLIPCTRDPYIHEREARVARLRWKAAQIRKQKQEAEGTR